MGALNEKLTQTLALTLTLTLTLPQPTEPPRVGIFGYETGDVFEFCRFLPLCKLVFKERKT